MRDITLLVIFVVVASVVTIGICLLLGQIYETNYLFGQLAARLGGRVQPAGWGQRPAVAFRHGDIAGRVDWFTTGGRKPISYTRVRLAWSAGPLRCEVFPQKVVHRLGKLLGMEDFEIGVPEFDHDYIISGSDRERLCELLNGQVRTMLNHIRARADHGDMYFSLNGHEMQVRRRGVFDDVVELEHFVRTATALCDAIASGGRTGIQFLDEVSVAEVEPPGATCQVCGEQISADPVLCKSCRTPHHHDCWEYYGKCSTFGCGERACFRPRRQAKAKGRK